MDECVVMIYIITPCTIIFDNIWYFITDIIYVSEEQNRRLIPID